jgi:4-carboxymuconolactone decarboxylase
MTDTSSRLARALAILHRLDPKATERVHANLESFTPGTTELVLGYAFADVVGRNGIDC